MRYCCLWRARVFNFPIEDGAGNEITSISLHIHIPENL